MNQDTFLRRLSKRCMSHKRERDAMDPWLQRFGEMAKKGRRTMPTMRDVESAQRSSALELLRRIQQDERSIQRSDSDQIFDDQIDSVRIDEAHFGYDLTKTIEALGETVDGRTITRGRQNRRIGHELA